MRVKEKPASEKRPAAAGWFSDPKMPNTRRYWTGEAWSDQRYVVRPNASSQPPPLKWGERPGGLIWGAVLLAGGLGFFAGGFFLVSEQAGWIATAVVAYFTSALFAIGVIAKGVELGIRAARHRQDLDF